MQNGRKSEPEGINNQLPSTQEEADGCESDICVKWNLDLQDQDLVQDHPETTNGQAVAEMQNGVSGNSQSEGPVIPNEEWAELRKYPPIGKGRLQPRVKWGVLLMLRMRRMYFKLSQS